VTSSSAHAIRVTGISRLMFRHGFSSDIVPTLTKTRRQPIQSSSELVFVVRTNNRLVLSFAILEDIPNYLHIDIVRVDDIQRVEHIELIDTVGNVLIRQTLTVDNERSSWFVTNEQLTPPVQRSLFFIRVSRVVQHAFSFIDTSRLRSMASTTTDIVFNVLLQQD
jgi:hypothetical protein